MLTCVKVTEKMRDYGRISRLYERAFPENERRPLGPLINDQTGCGDFIAFYDGEEFCGFACLLSFRDMTHILYLAMEESARGRGYGSAALEIIRRRYPGQRILADLEAEEEGADNNEERRRRRDFYLRAGYEVTEVSYRWREVAYEILSQGGQVTRADFKAFWTYFGVENTAFSAF